MKRWLKNLISITFLVLSLGLIVSTIMYLKNNSDVAYSLSKVEIALEETITKDETVTDGSTVDGTSSSEDPDVVNETPADETGGDITTTSDDTTVDDVIVDKSLDDEILYTTNSGAESNGIVDSVISKSLSVLSINNQISTGFIVLLLIGSFFFISSLGYLILSKFGKVTLFDKIIKLILFIVVSKVIAIAITIGLIYLTNTYII
jgi:hypothetical protein